MRFDPMTGEPIDEENGNENTMPQQEYSQAIYGQKAEPIKRASKVPVIVGCIAAVAVVAIGVVVAMSSGMFLSDSQKVAKAAYNTFSESSALIETLMKSAQLEEKEELTYSAKVGYDVQNVEFKFVNTKEDQQLWFSADMAGLLQTDAAMMLTDEELQLYAPILGDTQFFYNYVGENNGFLMSQANEEEVEALNQGLALLYESLTKKETASEFKEKVTAWFEALEVEAIDKEEFEIDDKDVKCAGYEIVIDEKATEELVDIWLDEVERQLEQTGIFESAMFVNAGESWDEFINTMKDGLSEVPEMTLSMYVHSNELAAIVVEVEGEDEELAILFQGGDYRAQNIVIEADGEEVLEIAGETEGTEETKTVTVEGQEILETVYDSKSGEFELELKESAGSVGMKMSATLTCDQEGFILKDGEVEVEGVAVEFDFSVVPEADFEKMDGERFDLGNADEAAFMELTEQIEEALGGLGLGGFGGGSDFDDDYNFDDDYDFDDDYNFDDDYDFDDDMNFDDDYDFGDGSDTETLPEDDFNF